MRGNSGTEFRELSGDGIGRNCTEFREFNPIPEFRESLPIPELQGIPGIASDSGIVRNSGNCMEFQELLPIRELYEIPGIAWNSGNLMGLVPGAELIPQCSTSQNRMYSRKKEERITNIHEEEKSEE